MTLVLGLLATDGLVIASDSQMSMGVTGRRGQKVYLSDNGQFAFGLSGHGASLQRFGTALGNTELVGTARAVQDQLQGVAARVLIPQYDAVRNVSGGLVSQDKLPIAEAVVGVYCEGEPHLFLVDGETLVTDLANGFASTGWGTAFANHAAATFRELREGGLTTYQSEMLCFRVVEDAIEASGTTWTLRGPTQIATIRLVNGRPLAERRPDDDQVLQDAVDSWVRLEAERFRQHQPGG